MQTNPLLSVMAISLLFLGSAGAASSGEPKAGAADLEGKYVLVFLKDKQVYALEKVQFRNLGKQTFLVGNRIYLGSSKAGEGGYPVWIEETNLVEFRVFATVDELKNTKGGKHAALLFEGTMTPEPVPPSAPPSPRVEPAKDVLWRGDWAAIAGAIGLVMFLGGLLAGSWWNKGRTTPVEKKSAAPGVAAVS